MTQTQNLERSPLTMQQQQIAQFLISDEGKSIVSCTFKSNQLFENGILNINLNFT
jgi:hypothetical protein